MESIDYILIVVKDFATIARNDVRGIKILEIALKQLFHEYFSFEKKSNVFILKLFSKDIDSLMKEMDALDDMISSCEIYNRENSATFVETSSEDEDLEDLVDLENIRLSEQNFQASPLYKKESVIPMKEFDKLPD